MPNATVVGRRTPDLRAQLGGFEIGVEVKAPFVPVLNRSFCGDDAAVIAERVGEAGKQLKKGRANLVVLVPALRTPVCVDRDQLVKAIIGEEALEVSVSWDSNVEPPPPRPTFRQTGKLARLRPSKSSGASTDLTRIGAVMTIEERLAGDDEHLWVEHAALVVHNPFAEVPIPPAVFGTLPQLVPDRDGMYWTDRGGPTGNFATERLP